MAYYVLDDNNNKIEAYDKEGFLAFLENAISEGTLAGIASDSAFVDKLKCCVSGQTNKIAFVSQATYNTLEANNQLISNCMYFITDDESLEDITNALTTINNNITSINNRLDALGFKTGVATYSGLNATPVSNTLKKQGKYALFNFAVVGSPAVVTGGSVTITLPDDFKPKANTTILVAATYNNGVTLTTYKAVQLTTAGTITINTTDFYNDCYIVSFEIVNSGWELA